MYANATAVRLLGDAMPEAVVGLPVVDIVAHEDRAMVMARVRAMGVTGVAAEMQRERLLRADGTIITAEVAALPLQFDGHASFLAVARDTSEQERMQALLAQSERLAGIGLLAAVVAHEINNPLAYALLNLEQVADGMRRAGAPEPWTRGVDDAIDGARRVQRIVRDLRTFAGSLRDESERADVVAAVDAALKLADNELRFRARVVRVVSRVAWVRANENRLTQVFLNLLVNAAHAIPEQGGARSEVRVEVSQRDGEVRVCVRDKGVGIAPEHLSKLFDPFFTTRAPGRGMGLGLSICHSTVTAYGGRIEVESNVGEGSAFTVVLPAETSLPERVKTPTPGQPMKALTVGSRRLLLVEDERNMRTVLHSLLAPRYEVVTAATGREALHALEADGEWALVLCDLLMPEVTGMELYAWLEAHRPELCTRVVFMTGGAFTDRARELLERTAGRWIEKPFEFDALVELLGRVEAENAVNPSAE